MNQEEEQIELIKKVQNENDNKSYNKLLKQYEPLIYSLSNHLKNTYKNTPMEKEDLKNVLSYNFYISIKEFDLNKKTSFPSFTKQFLLFKGLNYSRSLTTNKHQVLNYSNIPDEIIDSNETNEENLLNDLIDAMPKSQLTKIEYEIMSLLTQGKTIPEIVKITKKSRQTIYGTKKRAIDKIIKKI